MTATRIIDLVEALIGGDRRALARSITLVEARRVKDREDAEAVLSRVMPLAGGALRVGITGVPGVGKSTLIEALGNAAIDCGHRVAVLSVDPSSTISGGSILGDKTRMATLSHKSQAFVRPSPTVGRAGGVAPGTREAIYLCEAAGFDFIMVETVGVGQSELHVASMTDMFVLLLLPGAGDELQGIKRGVMELADLVAVNKCDGELTAAGQRTVAEFAQALRFMPRHTIDWAVPVVSVSALTSEGIEGMLETIMRFGACVLASGAHRERRNDQAREWLWEEIRQGLGERFFCDPALEARAKTIEDKVVAGNLSGTAGASQLLDSSLKKQH